MSVFLKESSRRTRRSDADIVAKRFKKPEEKETDVNIAIQLVSGALLDRYDKAILVSADTDLKPAVGMVRNIQSKQIEVGAPPGRFKDGRGLAREITEVMIEQSLFPDKVILSKGKAVFRPRDYNPPF